MSKKRHQPEEVVTKLRQVEVLTPQGRTVAEAVRLIAVTEVTYCGGLKGDQVERLTEQARCICARLRTLAER